MPLVVVPEPLVLSSAEVVELVVAPLTEDTDVALPPNPRVVVPLVVVPLVVDTVLFDPPPIEDTVDPVLLVLEPPPAPPLRLGSSGVGFFVPQATEPVTRIRNAQTRGKATSGSANWEGSVIERSS